MEHDPRPPHVVLGGAEEAVFAQRHIADEGEDEQGDAEDDQTQGVRDAHHLGAFSFPARAYAVTGGWDLVRDLILIVVSYRISPNDVKSPYFPLKLTTQKEPI